MTCSRWKHLCHPWQDKALPWNNTVGFHGDDNSSFVRRRKNNSVHLQICQVELSLSDPGCVCHLANRCCQHDMKQWPLSVWELLLAISSHFQNRFKKMEDYKIYQVFKSIEAFKDCQALQHPLAQPPEVHNKDTAATTNPFQNIAGARKR